MIELFGNLYPWSRDTLKVVTDRLMEGDELTINSRSKTACVNKYSKEPLDIHIDLAVAFIHFGLVGIDCGNTETGEAHYNFESR